MTVPTLASVSPTSGHSAGGTVVELVGTGFAQHPPAPADGPGGALLPAMRVTFGGAEAAHVEVVSTTLAYCLTPDGDPDGGPVAVVVQNLDSAGAPVVGETVTLAAAFTYVRPDLNVEGELARVLRALILMLRRGVHPNVVFTTSTDYAEDGTGDQINYAAVQKTPALILANLDVPEDRVRSCMEPVRITLPGGRFAERRPALVCDVTLTLVGVIDGDGASIRILNLMQATRLLFQKRTKLRVDRDADDPFAGYVEYDMFFSFAGGVAVTHPGENADVESFAGQLRVEGVWLEDVPGLPGGPAAVDGLPYEGTTRIGWVASEDPVVVETQQKG